MKSNSLYLLSPLYFQYFSPSRYQTVMCERKAYFPWFLPWWSLHLAGHFAVSHCLGVDVPDIACSRFREFGYSRVNTFIPAGQGWYYGKGNWNLIEVLHGSHVAWQEQKIPFPMGKEVLSYAKYFHCSCHATWLPCKTFIGPIFRLAELAELAELTEQQS